MDVFYVFYKHSSFKAVCPSSVNEQYFLLGPAIESLRTEVTIEKRIKEANVKVKITILKGTPGPEIVRYANEKSVDLVVIGSRGLNSLQEMVLGSVSHKVMKRVTCPALVVK